MEKLIDKLEETAVGEWMAAHPCPSWIAPTAALLSVVLSVISLLLSAGVIAR